MQITQAEHDKALQAAQTGKATDAELVVLNRIATAYAANDHSVTRDEYSTFQGLIGEALGCFTPSIFDRK